MNIETAPQNDPDRARIMGRVHALAEMLCTHALQIGASPLETVGAMLMAIGGLYEAEPGEREYIRPLVEAIEAKFSIVDGRAAPVAAAPDFGEVLVSAAGASEARILAAAHEMSRACVQARFTNREMVDMVGVLLLGMLDSPSKPRVLIQELVRSLHDILETH